MLEEPMADVATSTVEVLLLGLISGTMSLSAAGQYDPGWCSFHAACSCCS